MCTYAISYEYMFYNHTILSRVENITAHFAVFCNTLFNADSSSVLEMSVLDGVTELKEWV